MNQNKILLAEDEPFLGKVVKESLEKAGYYVCWAQHGQEAWEAFCNESFTVIVLDVMMPYTDGFTLASKIREHNTAVPIMFLTAKAEINDIKEGYASGGNDYLRKPFSLDELFLRIDQLVQRFAVTSRLADKIVFGKCVFSVSRQELERKNTIVKLSFREAELLSMLLENRNKVLDRKYTLMKLWGDDNYFNARNMDVYITKLRKKIGTSAGVEILNVRGFGYKLIC